MNRELLKGFVFARIKNDSAPMGYDGFDMSGYDNSFYKNMGLLSRFSDVLKPKQEWRNPRIIAPVFWKGSGNLVEFSAGYSDHLIEIQDISGMSTLEIITRILELQQVTIDDLHQTNTGLKDYFN